MILKSCEIKEKSVAEIVVEVDPVEFESAMAKSFARIKNQIAVPGFRKGKAPRKIIEKMYGAAVLQGDALEILLPDVLSFSIEESKIDPIGQPRVSDVDIKTEGGADITISAAVYPEVKLGEYKGLSASKPAAEVQESEVDGEVGAVRLRNARIEKVDRQSAIGDIAVIDFEGFVDGVPFEGGKGGNYELELGSGRFIPGFEEKVVGMASGDERDIDLVFPENYTEPLAGKPVVFRVKLNEVKEKLLPELDDEFAKDVSEFDTLQEYRSDIREKILTSRQNDADIVFENALMDKIVETMEADIPDAMIEEQFEIALSNFTHQISTYGMDPGTYLQMMNITPDKFKENMMVSSEKQVRVMVALEKIAALEGIEVSDEDIEIEYEELSKRAGMDMEQLKESVGIEKVTRELKVRRAAKIVTESAIVEEASKAEEEVKPAAKPKKAASKKAAQEKPEADTGSDAVPKKRAAKKPKTDQGDE